MKTLNKKRNDPIKKWTRHMNRHLAKEDIALVNRLEKMFIKNCLAAKLCPTICNPMDYMAHQTPVSMGFSRQEYWSGLPFPPPEDLPDSGIKTASPALTGFFTTEPPGKTKSTLSYGNFFCLHPWKCELCESKEGSFWIEFLVPLEGVEAI